MEAYRSGHNEPHSKCGCPQGHVGSNPTASAKKSSSQAVFWTFLFSPLSQKRIKFQESLKKGNEDALYAILTFNESAQDTMTILHF